VRKGARAVHQRSRKEEERGDDGGGKHEREREGGTKEAKRGGARAVSAAAVVAASSKRFQKLMNQPVYINYICPRTRHWANHFLPVFFTPLVSSGRDLSHSSGGLGRFLLENVGFLLEFLTTCTLPAKKSQIVIK
jgi:hypothetical protein